jgi:hypothetical protein
MNPSKSHHIVNHMKTTLTYIGKATKARDGYAGFKYVHHWGTGYQTLIFAKKQPNR